MKIKYGKILVREKMEEVVIDQWAKLHGYELKMTQITCRVFKSNLMVCIGTHAEFRRFLREACDHETPEDDPIAMFTYFNNKRDDNARFNCLLLTREVEWRAEDYGILAHELHHYAHIQLDHIGISQAGASEEAFAYFLGHHMELVVRALARLTKTTRENKHKRK